MNWVASLGLLPKCFLTSLMASLDLRISSCYSKMICIEGQISIMSSLIRFQIFSFTCASVLRMALSFSTFCNIWNNVWDLCVSIRREFSNIAFCSCRNFTSCLSFFISSPCIDIFSMDSANLIESYAVDVGSTIEEDVPVVVIIVGIPFWSRDAIGIASRGTTASCELCSFSLIIFSISVSISLICASSPLGASTSLIFVTLSLLAPFLGDIQSQVASIASSRILCQHSSS